MSKELTLSTLFDGFREKETIFAVAKKISKLAEKLPEKMYIMEVCGGHTHTIMKYGINQMMPENIEFVHGPGCPVCIMPKSRIDAALALANMKDTILVTLGDMIKVPGSNGSLAKARGEGCDVRFVYSPTEILKIAAENPDKTTAIVTICEGKFHQVKKMFAVCGKNVVHLKRISIGDLYLDSNLHIGETKMLSELDKMSIFMGNMH